MFFQNFVQGFLSENKWTLIIYILIILIFFPLEAVALPKLYGGLFDKMKSGGTADFWNVFENIKKMNLPGAVASVFITWFVIIISYAFKHHLECKLSPKYMTYVRKILFEKTINAFKENYADVKTGEYLSRMLELMRNAKDLFQYILNQFFPYLIAVCFTTGYIAYSNTDLGNILIMSMVLCVIINYFGGNYLIDLIAERENYMNEVVNQGIQNSVDNLMNIYLNNESNNEIDKNHDVEEIGREKMSHIMFTQNFVISSCHIIIGLAYGFGLVNIYNMVRQKKISSPEAIVFVLILGQFVSFNIDLNAGYIHNVAYKLGIIKAAEPFIEKIFVDESHRVNKTGIKTGDIEFKDIVFRYDESSDEVLFDELNLKIVGGSKNGIMGRSGSGKTTLMKMLVGLYKPEDGVISIDGTDIGTMDIDYLRENVNYVNQKTQLFDDTVLYNMKYGNPHLSEEDISAKLKKYKLNEVFSDLPDGVRANAGLSGGNLSGGMQKLTILMRGILKKGDIIVLDEPLAGLDQKTITKVIAMILAETDGKTLLVITHDKAILPYMDRVVDINKL
jgi:ATP-binding cassette subfamily B (MDR/TAP) protein 7/ABC transporter ATM